ncbi:MAG: CZB domain-containing protein [Acidobacteria bacterium]|nr:CZB domain-containing protein [Acidobacteriota bacterium]
MNFDNVIIAHTTWKVKIQNSINSGERIDPGTISKDNNCELGKWIYGEGAKYGSLPEFQMLKQKHAQFHLIAAETIRKVAGLPKSEALKLLGLGTAYSQASSCCTNAISALRSKIG